ncbi:hypothetical protein [Streptomyces sp. NBC_01190]|uniref:hypothetical protein n=1 Tax=Streptomyces sp. NBC_01190 TaxID=2903767 RepID=UPI00386C5369|nr:hypothetical protein OG519_31305 [Streptomyces sp. NBC_01190]
MRVRGLAAAAGAVVLLTAGPALAEAKSQAGGPVVDLLCKGSATAKLDDHLSTAPHLVRWTVDGVLTACNDGLDRPAATGDGAWHEAGQEVASCSFSDARSATYTQKILWANGEKSLISGTLSIDDHEAGESLTKAEGRVVSGAYKGDNVLETSTVMTTHPETCEEAGLTPEEAVGTFVFSH